MKRTQRFAKLSIGRDTVKHLVADEMARVRGGAPDRNACAGMNDTKHFSSCSTDAMTKCTTWIAAVCGG